MSGLVTEGDADVEVFGMEWGVRTLEIFGMSYTVSLESTCRWVCA